MPSSARQTASDEEEITVTVHETNHAPLFAAIHNHPLDLHSFPTRRSSDLDQDSPAQTLTFSLVNGITACGTVTSCTVPSGAAITTGGAFTWKIGRAHV